jgi:hypothetical protein
MQIFILGLTALAVSSFFSPSFAQKTAAPAIKTPSTQSELINKEPVKETTAAPAEKTETTSTPAASEEIAPSGSSAPAQRRLQQHGLGIGIGQTFLLGKFADHGENKITGDLLYTYSASYSFDIMVNTHYSNHQDGKERVNLMGLNAAIKSRMFEFDNFSPFIFGGLGFYAPKVKRVINGTTKWSDRKASFGLNFGGGADLRLNDQYVVGAMAQFHWPFNQNQTGQPDVKGYYLKLLLTLSYLF